MRNGTPVHNMINKIIAIVSLLYGSTKTLDSINRPMPVHTHGVTTLKKKVNGDEILFFIFPARYDVDGPRTPDVMTLILINHSWHTLPHRPSLAPGCEVSHRCIHHDQQTPDNCSTALLTQILLQPFAQPVAQCAATAFPG